MVVEGDLVVRLEKFFAQYVRMWTRHFYEHIHLGKPCRLYFDLEFQKIPNPNFNTDAFFPEFYSLIEKILFDYADTTNVRFLELDSTTDVKFSRHVIVHTDKLFPCNTDLQPLVHTLCEKMRELNLGVVKNDALEDTLIVDSSVYSRNQNFRMYLS